MLAPILTRYPLGDNSVDFTGRDGTVGGDHLHTFVTYLFLIDGPRDRGDGRERIGGR